ncbi:MAG: DUF5706 domain-containing protein [Lysobacterales bacterium]|nr:hypothetical protein [Xanthomonadales bacterium]MCB1613479.1 hypothetical protein [Xanthomonadales bacterium]MCP5473816.1 hypothetical protein [Rhodanobacteraceae bacterium]
MSDVTNPSSIPGQSHIGMREHFQGILGRNTADYSIMSAQRHHIQLSRMADAKANIIITVSSIVLTIAMGRLNDPELRLSMLTLAAFSLAALLMAILAVLPKYRPLRLEDPKNLPDYFNIMFFGHFSEIPREEFCRLWADALRTDAAVYENWTNDLYSMGTYLARHKYRYLRFSYVFFLTGFVIAALEQVSRFTF